MPLSPDAKTYSKELFQSRQTVLLKQRDTQRSAVRQNLSDIDDAARLAGYPGVLQPEIDYAVAVSIAKKDALCRAYEWDGTTLSEGIITSIESETITLLQQLLAGLISTEKERIALKARRTRRSDLCETEKLAELSRHVERAVSETQKKIHGGLTLSMLEAKTTKSNVQSRQRVTIHQHGPQSRVNLNSTDYSQNVLTVTEQTVFSQVKEALRLGVPDETELRAILANLEDFELSVHHPTALRKFQTFVNSAASYMTLLAPFIPGLMTMLHK